MFERFVQFLCVLAAICVGVAVLTGSGCTDSERTRIVLEDAGYIDIDIQGWALNACSRGADTCTAFAATSILGRRVHGVVACDYRGCAKVCGIQFTGR